MVMTAEFETCLTEESLSQDGSDLVKKIHEDRSRGLAHEEGWILFKGLRRRYADPNFARHAGLELNTGRLFVGNVQDESPAIQELSDPVLAEFEDGAIANIRASVFFELERLFDRPAQLQLLGFYTDGKSMEFLPQGEQGKVADWVTRYRGRVERSLLQRPVIEDDFTTQASLNRSFRERAGCDRHSPRILSMLYGERLYAELKMAYPKV